MRLPLVTHIELGIVHLRLFKVSYAEIEPFKCSCKTRFHCRHSPNLSLWLYSLSHMTKIHLSDWSAWNADLIPSSFSKLTPFLLERASTAHKNSSNNLSLKLWITHQFNHRVNSPQGSRDFSSPIRSQLHLLRCGETRSLVPFSLSLLDSLLAPLLWF